jgi:arylsulfatase A-like enzyme
MNILLITTDEHRADCVGSGRFGTLRTPALDRLRSEGTTFASAYSNCPICMPTRFTWLYGLYASQGGQRLLANALDWPTDLRSAAQCLRRAGYRTAMYGKLHSLMGLFRRDIVAHKYETVARGFDDVCEVSGGTLSYYYDCEYSRYLESKGLLEEWRSFAGWWLHERDSPAERYEPSVLSAEDHLDGFVARRAMEWLSRYDEDRPFFMHVSFCGPHFPITPSEEYFNRYRPEDVPAPLGVDDAEESELWRKNRALYAGFVEQTDGHISRVLDVLDDRGLTEDTLVIYTADHGELIGDYGLNHKSQPYDAACRTPVILRKPGLVNRGTTREALVEAVDLPATILDAAGLGSDPSELLPLSPGYSFLPCATGSRARHRDWIYSECGVLPRGWRMIFDGRHKLVQRGDGGVAVFDLKDDPAELRPIGAGVGAPGSAGPGATDGGVNASAPGSAELLSKLVQSQMCCVAPNRDSGFGRGVHNYRHVNRSAALAAVEE